MPPAPRSFFHSCWSALLLLLFGAALAGCGDMSTGPRLSEAPVRPYAAGAPDTANAHPQVYELPPIVGNGCDDDLHPTGPACNPGDDPPPCEVNCSGSGGEPGYGGGGGTPPPEDDAGTCPATLLGKVITISFQVGQERTVFKFESPMTRTGFAKSPADYRINPPVTSEDGKWVAVGGTIRVSCKGVYTGYVFGRRLWVGTATGMEAGSDISIQRIY